MSAKILYQKASFRKQAESGLGAVTLVVFGALLAVVLFCAYHILPFYYYYYDLQNQMESMIRVASMESDAEIRRRLLYYIKKYQIPVREEELKISRAAGEMEISLKYKEVFYITWKGKDHIIRVFPFHAHAKGKF